MTNLPTLPVLAAVLCIDLDDPDDADDLEVAGLLLARRVLRELGEPPLPIRCADCASMYVRGHG